MFSGLNVALVDNNKNIRAAAEVIAANIREGDMQIRQVAMAISAVGNTALQGVADTVGTGGKALQDTAVSIASTLRTSTQFVAGSLNAAADTIAMTVGTSVDRMGMSLDTAVTSTNRVVAVAYVSTSRFALETVSGIGSLSDQAKTLLIKKDLATEALDRPLPPKKYQTTIAMKNDKVVIGELSFNILKSFGVPYRQTPVILFSTPKIAITDDAGDVTFHDVEVGTHHIEIHIDDKTVETREVVVEPPAKINLTEDSAVHVKLPLIEIQVETPAQTAMHSAAPAGMPWYWLVVIPLLMINAVMGFLLIVHRQRRKEEVAAKI